MQKHWLTRSVLIISLVSLFNDASSELLYPVLPVYLGTIGFGALWIGIIEGVAEAAAGLSKGWFGKWSDMRGERLPFIRLGYLLSSLAKPLIVLFPHVAWAMFMRASDRLGKGVRTGARDALLAHDSDPKHRGKVFGFHRAFDTLGAFIGPMLALAWMFTHRGESVASLFYLALIPGAITMIVLLFLKDKNVVEQKSARLPSWKAMFSYWSESNRDYKRVVGGFLLFALFNSSDLFLLMALHKVHSGMENCFFGMCFTADEITILYYILFNLVYALFSYPAGYFSDKYSPKTIFIIGLVCFVMTYAGFAFMLFTGNAPGVVLPVTLMCVYGVYAALNDGVGKAWISVLIPKSEKASALGFFAGASSIALLGASTLAGVLWAFVHPSAVFAVTALLTFLVIIYLGVFTVKPVHAEEQTATS
jgi:MFS family permease